MDDIILEMRRISKSFPGVKALDRVNFQVRRSEIHCLVGENGAGKTTLMKVLSGVHPFGTYEGDILLNGEIQRFHGIRDSESASIAIISQELALIPDLTIYENIFFGHELMRGRLVDWHRTILESEKILKTVRLDVNPTAKVGSLRVGEQQLVEIAKTLSKNAKVIILDEPTSSLNEEDSDNLLRLLRELRDGGATIIMISHRLGEVVKIADTVTVLRDGTTVCSLDAAEKRITEREIIRHMVGREIENIYPRRERRPSDEVLFEVRNFSARNPSTGRTVLKDVSLNVRRGEIVGLAGLMGAGRTELALALFGNTPGYKLTSGEVFLEGAPVKFSKPSEAIAAGVAYASEDRKKNGLILIQDICFNITLANLRTLLRGLVIDRNEEVVQANRYKEDLRIKAPSIQQTVLNLSGGNQQKTSLAKWLFARPKLLILDEPTRGIDVGAKFEIYTIMNELVKSGMSIVMISSELMEILGMSDRIYVMSEGAITGELNAADATEENIMEFATNTKEAVANG